MWEEDAREAGWHEGWKGNDMADHFAKLARPALDSDPAEFMKNKRLRTKMLRELLLSLSPDTLWQDMQRNRPEGGSRRQASTEPAAQAHAPAFLNGSWTCTVCGKISRTFAALSLIHI